ncbi:hypothetical protein QJS04_geneDACA022151 [Acorus gramineus]|uniref:C3HC-type domain-containing protein n=1 Tax=Acorus gramineus TaxID=55184 RepID=A0AAV9BQ60_ACOGR|nr:hypothetical protein QJS04_geneDACA022151 [Acorus gramineus]
MVGRSASPPPTTAASSAGASSPALQANAGSIDWLGNGQSSKGGSVSAVVSQHPRTSLSMGGHGRVVESSQPLCRPWERGDLLRRLATFSPSNWSGKPKIISSLACSRRGWININIDKIECELCGMQLSFTTLATWSLAEFNRAGEAFHEQLDSCHRTTCPWRGNCCADSLVQFPPTPPSALVGGFKDRCDGLFQFLTLPVIASSAIDKMRLSRDAQIDNFLAQSLAFLCGELGPRASGLESSHGDVSCTYSQAQKLISLCGWEPRWLLNVQDCEEHSAQSAKNACSTGPTPDKFCASQDLGLRKNALSASGKRDTRKKKAPWQDARSDTRSPLLDCSLCGATVRVWDFLTVPRPAHFTPNHVDTTDTGKKITVTRGVSAASGISGWVAADGMEKEQTDARDEAETTQEAKSLSNAGVDLNLTMAGGLPSSSNFGMPEMMENFNDGAMGRDLMIGQPAGSEVGDRAASYESRGPSTRKRSAEEGGSTVDRPLNRMNQADSIEGTITDKDGDEVDDHREYLGGSSKRARGFDIFDSYHSSGRVGSSGAGPSRSLGFEIDLDINRAVPFRQESYQNIGAAPSNRDSARASSVIAMDTICHGADDDSMESVENHPGDVDDVQFASPAVVRNPDINDASELNYSNLAQQSVCFQTAAREKGASSVNEGEILNAETVTAPARDGLSFGISGGSVGMGASHEAEIHGVDVSVHRGDSVVGDAEPVAEVIENQGQTGESAPDPGLMDEFVPEVDREDPHGDSQDMMSRSVARADSGSKVYCSMKEDSVESGEKTSHTIGNENSAHPSLSCNAIIKSGHAASKEEVMQEERVSLTENCLYQESDYVATNRMVLANGETECEEPGKFDPIKHHNPFCPWVNGNVAAAGCSSGSSNSISSTIALSGWQLTLDALDAFQSSGHVPNQTVESESAASLYKDEHLTPGKKRLTRHSTSKSHGQP